MDLKHLRNFSIIAHIDHGKSTLADRMLEVTGTVEARKMKEQVLDSMELERERGITIKMQPVRMEHMYKGEKFVLNLIDTPGHIDFAYEVSRAMKAVEGTILLVDSTQGVQAQTLSVLAMAREAGLVIIPAVSKVDSPIARVDEVKDELAKLLDVDTSEILEVSGKTGQGVPEILGAIIERIKAPVSEGGVDGPFRALVFDFGYSSHKGIIVYVRVLDGRASKNDTLLFSQAREKFGALGVGIFHPDMVDTDTLSAGEIGYILTGIKKPGIATVGDTITTQKASAAPLPGYMKPRPVVWASVYPESADDFTVLRQSLEILQLSDSSLSFEEEVSGVLGRGFRCGFLGMLHMEIVTERLRREFTLEIIVTTPSITYEVEMRNNGKHEVIYSAHLFPDYGSTSKIFEQWVKVKIITPPAYVSPIMTLLYDHEAIVGATELFGDNRTAIEVEMPLRELMRNFFDDLKSVSSGFASLAYELAGNREADVARLDILVAEEIVPAFSKVVSRRRIEKEAEDMVEKLHGILPRQLFNVKIQGCGLGRIISSRSLTAMKKDVTGYLYGGDISRKKKLWEKQKKGKKKLQAQGTVDIPHEVFLKMVRGGSEN
ncbi:MAG: Elongation factor 4 [Parcubacteria group bacterium GW2011_GWA1_44_13]|uniref:Elongation factor 4 n=1 Tax=Candidatus Nomurabacteria bacterium GW2011_GWB1_44_12 TaxID=1618748 RepID=A0A837IAV4_9BACT|nr:MAG: Elongation factor 4 [Candidatus Nomurabacteria bacterium GW2011_GWD1_44_10]KKT37130.1 MAG: Elongation factor 4 [Candidatus Nomurabacteria bacterium GW2011_GWB1_44_12]KKT38425.1 MAG: Elongation factor 4 [Parcubacteria group bacterium GW2011_GWA1_44_13]